MITFSRHQTVRVVSVIGSLPGPREGDVGNIVDAPGEEIYTVECLGSDGRLLWLSDLPARNLEPVGALAFEVESVFQAFGRPHVMARKLFEHTFTVLPGARLADCEVLECEIPRSHDAEGRQRYDLYGFVLAPGSDPGCEPGDVVRLQESDRPAGLSREPASSVPSAPTDDAHPWDRPPLEQPDRGASVTRAPRARPMKRFGLVEIVGIGFLLVLMAAVLIWSLVVA